MWYYVTITRGVQTFYVISPKGGKYELSVTKEKNIYLWETEVSCKADTRWQHLILPGDTVNYVRTYTC